MVRTLLIVFAAGLVLATVSFGIAGAIGGPDLWRQNWHVGWDDDNEDFGFHRDTSTNGGVRRVEWAGAERLDIYVPGEVTYVQGPPSIVIEGPPNVVDKVIVEGGALRLPDGYDGHARNLEILVSAPKVHAFALHGAQTLKIEGYDQDTLDIAVHGSGDIEAGGRTRQLSLAIQGSGEADLDGLTADDARVTLNGSGDARLSARNSAEVEIAGSGDVVFSNRPARLTSQVSGSGEVCQGGED